MSEEKPVQVVSVAVFNKDGALLFGRRKDNGKWTLPGGHMEGDESELAGAQRELEEEAGFSDVDLVHLGSEVITGFRGGKIEVHAFMTNLDGEASSVNDPDDEVEEWRWVDVDDGLPAEIAGNLHSPKNVTLKLLDIKPAKEEKLAKALDYGTPEFKQWFQGSKVTRHDGLPLVVYHGTSKDMDFKSFKIGKRGAWFTIDPKEASSYANENDSRGPVFRNGEMVDVNNAPRVIPAHLSIKNPYQMTRADMDAMNMSHKTYQKAQAEFFDDLRLKGHDGVDFGNGTYVAFHPHQIKSIHNTKPSSEKTDLMKMAVADIPPGKPIRPSKDPEQPTSHDYSHVLPRPDDARLIVDTGRRPNGTLGLTARLDRLHELGSMGSVSAVFDPARKSLHIGESFLGERHRNRGYGKAMYEALMAHAKNILGAEQIVGATHSTLAHNVHASLSQKHGMDYTAKINPGMEDEEQGENDDRYGNYRYLLKSEDDGWRPGDELYHTSHMVGADFTKPPPKLDPQHVVTPHTLTEAIRQREDLHDGARHIAWKPNHEWSANCLRHTEKHFQNLAEGLRKLTGTPARYAGHVANIFAANEDQLGEGVGGHWQSNKSVVRLHHDRVHGIMKHAVWPTNRDGVDYESKSSWKTMLHELFHSVGHQNHVYEPAHVESRPYMALEEATTELPAQHYLDELIKDHWKDLKGNPAFDSGRGNLVFSYGGGKGNLERMTSYMNICDRFVQLVAKAEPHIDSNEELHNAVINHSLAVKSSAQNMRLRRIIDRMLINHGLQPPAAGDFSHHPFDDARKKMKLFVEQFMAGRHDGSNMSPDYLDEGLARARADYDRALAAKGGK